jgi:hypothetical protein
MPNYTYRCTDCEFSAVLRLGMFEPKCPKTCQCCGGQMTRQWDPTPLVGKASPPAVPNWAHRRPAAIGAPPNSTIRGVEVIGNTIVGDPVVGADLFASDASVEGSRIRNNFWYPDGYPEGHPARRRAPEKQDGPDDQ